MENNVEICILVRDDRLEKLEAILRRGLESGEADVW